MMTTDLGACEWFVWDLRRSNLIDRGQLDQIVGEFLMSIGYLPGAHAPDCPVFARILEHSPPWASGRAP